MFPRKCWHISTSHKCGNQYFGFKKLLKSIKFYKIDLVIVGPEEPLVKGITNFLKKHKIKVFGPGKYASQLEGSKAFMKKICFQIRFLLQDLKFVPN